MPLIIIRGAGDIASGIALRLHRSGYSIIMTDLPAPTSIRRTVCFSEALRLGLCTVEDVTAVRADGTENALSLAERGQIAVLADPEGRCIHQLRPAAVVDAILAKRNLGTAITDAPVVIGIGPGFTVGVDCHAAVETMRGHTLGRVLRAPAAGVFTPCMEIGQLVRARDIAATVNGVPMVCTIDGCLRGLLQAGLEVFPGMKCGDVDPRGQAANCTTASDKALAVGGGVLEALLHFRCPPTL